MRVALFDSNHNPVKIMDGPMRHFDANVPAGGYWREVPHYVKYLQDVPDSSTLPVWPTRWINALDDSSNLLDAEIYTDNAGSVTLSAPAGLTIKTADMVEHVESGGNITIVFPQEGSQYICIEENGKNPFSRQIDVIFQSTYADQLKKTVDSERDLRLVADITVGAITLDGDLTAQKNIAEAATLGAFEVLGGNASWSINWITATNTVVSLTAAELRAFAQAISVRRETEYAAARTAKDNIAVAANRIAADAALATYLGS
ncbi:DUF4376 domain-containing protein [uncultured Amphritea sp.]|uniref:DUF4376 domain-containing protein n=2 Tax=Pseudomonadota TaxID=1224 RepID=UPI0026119B8D|nr:DUF4376 domain-containing protein [uncultured Amphritea sp.]